MELGQRLPCTEVQIVPHGLAKLDLVMLTIHSNCHVSAHLQCVTIAIATSPASSRSLSVEARFLGNRQADVKAARSWR